MVKQALTGSPGPTQTLLMVGNLEVQVSSQRLDILRHYHHHPLTSLR